MVERGAGKTEEMVRGGPGKESGFCAAAPDENLDIFFLGLRIY
jgi:hypothetical protein